MRKLIKVIGIIVGVIVALVLLAFTTAASVPVIKDPPVDMNNHGAGSSSVEPAYSGLLRAFPATNEAFARASFTAVVMDRVGVQLHVE